MLTKVTESMILGTYKAENGKEVTKPQEK